MLDTKMKVLEKKERNTRQKLFEIRREKYSRSFYKSPERPKFVDVNVCETEEDENNKLNLITASGVERTKNSLRRRASVIEELNPGQVVRVCVSSKLEDKVTGDENMLASSSLPPIGKAPKKRRHSVAIVTNFGQHNMADLFTSVTSYMQSISEDNEEANISKDETKEKHSETALDEIGAWRAEQDNQLDPCLEQLSNLSLQTTFAEETSKDCSSNKNKICCGERVSGSNDSKSEGLEKTKTSSSNSSSAPSSPKRKVTHSRQNHDFPSSSRPQSSRSYSDSSLQERVAFRKCSTPVPVLSKKHSRVRRVDPNTSGAFRLEAESKMYEGAMGHKRRFRSLSAGNGPQESALTEKEAKMAEQVIIRQIEIKEGAEKMRKLSMQRFGDSKDALKVPRRHSSANSPTYARKRLETTANDVNNNPEGSPRPGITRRHTDNPQVLKKIVKNQCKYEKGQITMEKVLCKLSGDMPDCRYLRCDQNKHDQ
ncbi:hypothetical protein ACROYT_G020668 [Oculina patagonica]